MKVLLSGKMTIRNRGKDVFHGDAQVRMDPYRLIVKRGKLRSVMLSIKDVEDIILKDIKNLNRQISNKKRDLKILRRL